MSRIPRARDVAIAGDLLDTPPERGFDDIVQLARHLCGTQVALVTLLDRDRQWFKARAGFPHCQTNLDRSICRFVVKADRPIEIPDLTLDARTCGNPLVTGDPFLRFYAGAPLRAEDGTIGALCVIDDKPRENGLAATQRSMLELLARQVVDAIEARRHAATLEAAQRERAAGEHRWRSLFRDMAEGFLLARVSRDGDGRIRDWRYEEVNPAWERLLGVPARAAIGRTLREVIPDIEEEWIGIVAAAVECCEPVRFTRRLGTLGRWFDGTVQPLGDDRFSVTFREVTDRVMSERRRAGLVELGDLLGAEGSVAAMIRGATRLIGEALDVSHVAFGEIDATVETVTLADVWSAPGVPPFAGALRLSECGKLRDALLARTPLVVPDAADDSHTMEGESWLPLRTRAAIAVPVSDAGRTVALLLIHGEQPRRWTDDETAWLSNAAERIQLATVRRRAEEAQSIVNAEIEHRLKNTLAMVQAVAVMTLRDVLPRASLDRLTERLQALGRAHDLLHGARWRATGLRELVESALDNAGVLERCGLAGPTVGFGARSVMSASLLLHELATNAVKYGALSVPGGIVEIAWRLEDGARGRQLTFEWDERNGPPVEPPSRRGFGSRLVSYGLIGTGGAVVRYAETGLSATFSADAGKVGQA